jgi:hypothetical protein
MSDFGGIGGLFCEQIVSFRLQKCARRLERRQLDVLFLDSDIW